MTYGKSVLETTVYRQIKTNKITLSRRYEYEKVFNNIYNFVFDMPAACSRLWSAGYDMVGFRKQGGVIMATEKYLHLINKAIENLKDNDDGYGYTPIDFMRKNGVKSTDNMTIFLDSVGVYLEEIRCGLLADIEVAEAKKNGKSSVLSAIKKLCNDNYKAQQNVRPQLAYANYDESENKYVTVNGYWLIMSENPAGMVEMPENVKKDIKEPLKYKQWIPNKCDMHTVSLPALAKISTYLKARKATRNKRDKTWDRLVFEDFAVKGEWLEAAMKITGSSEIYVKSSVTALLMEGNGYTMVLMPIKNKETDKNTGEEKRIPITDFEEV